MAIDFSPHLVDIKEISMGLLTFVFKHNRQFTRSYFVSYTKDGAAYALTYLPTCFRILVDKRQHSLTQALAKFFFHF
jgi:hypothetical protein